MACSGSGHFAGYSDRGCLRSSSGSVRSKPAESRLAFGRSDVLRSGWLSILAGIRCPGPGRSHSSPIRCPGLSPGGDCRHRRRGNHRHCSWTSFRILRWMGGRRDHAVGGYPACIPLHPISDHVPGGAGVRNLESHPCTRGGSVGDLCAYRAG